MADTSTTAFDTRRSRDWRLIAAWVAAHELWLLALAAPLLLFPRGALPWLGVAALALGPLARWAATGRPSIRMPAEPALVVLAAMIAVGAWASLDPTMSAAKIWGLVLDLAVFLVVINAASDEARAVSVGGLLVPLTFGVAALALVGTDWHSARLANPGGIYDLLPTLVRGLPGSGVPVGSDLFHPREVAGTLALLTPACVALAFAGAGRARTLAAVAAAALGALVVVLTQTPQALGGLTIGLFLLIAWRAPWAWVLAGIAAFGMAFTLWFYGLDRLAGVVFTLDTFAGAGVSLRMDIWSRAWAMLGDLPFTGIGINTFPLVQSQFYTGFAIGPEPHAHNQLLQTALDLGLPGLAAFGGILALFAAAVWGGVREGRSASYRWLLAGLGAGVAAFMVFGLIDAVALGAKPSGALWFMLALPIARWRGARAPWASWLVTVGALVVGLVAIGVPNALRANLAILDAHRALAAAEANEATAVSEVVAARRALEDVAAAGPERAHVWHLLGRLYGWAGEPEQGLDALERQIALDVRAPYATYYPPGQLLRELTGAETAPDPGRDLLQVYDQWRARFPARAESHVLVARVLALYLDDPAAARVALDIGLAAGAEPKALLLEALREGDGE